MLIMLTTAVCSHRKLQMASKQPCTHNAIKRHFLFESAQTPIGSHFPILHMLHIKKTEGGLEHRPDQNLLEENRGAGF